MRLRTLSLARFGPFTDTVLDFSDGPRALHIVFGPNEAGKSTALRAITGLLFGIPEKTRDTHTHPSQELRVGGRLYGRDGSELEVWRRKGRKNTLLAASGEPLPDDALTPFLAGVSAQGFELGFGLDAARLRQGAEALLAGEGAVGQILFDAATGGASVERVLAELESKADELFKPRAKKARINAGLSEYKLAKDKLRDRIQLPEAWERQRAALAAKRSERAELEKRRQELAREQLKLARAKHALPQLARHRAFGLELSQLGPAPALEPGARARREGLSQQLGEVRSAIAPVERHLEVLTKRRDQQAVPDALVAVDLRRGPRAGRAARQSAVRARGPAQAAGASGGARTGRGTHRGAAQFDAGRGQRAISADGCPERSHSGAVHQPAGGPGGAPRGIGPP